MTSADLKALLGPEVLSLAVAEMLPWDKHAAIDFGEAIDWIFFGGALRDTPHHLITAEEEAFLHQKTLSALEILASIGLANIDMPGLLETLLPPPADPRPGSSWTGPWTTAGSTATSASCRPPWRSSSAPFPRPSRRTARWKDSVSLDYFVWARLWFAAPIVHHEALAHEAVAMTEELRVLVESEYEGGARDPYRDLPNEVRWDHYGFPRMLEARQGPPKGEDGKSSVTAGCFWICALLDLHYPILIGIPIETACWASPAPEVVKRIKEDVEAGCWSPIGAEL
ncbi:hypothetical protein PG994_000232 [Apiospora phragmitis]|uniref:Uncharacterized protein n=1 Tax=Apiospora phragmitis TaxID=2905665 RepID=A0ABR1X5S7_9PEZI